MKAKNFNKAYANKVSKAQWLKEHAHHAEEGDLGAIYDELTAKPEKKAEEAPKK